MPASIANANNTDFAEYRERERFSRTTAASEISSRMKHASYGDCYYVSAFTTTTGKAVQTSSYNSGSIYMNMRKVGVNKDAFEVLDSITLLKDNWDQEGSPAPAPSVISDAYSLVADLSLLNNKIHDIAIGPYGEVMIELKNKEKSIEFIYYSDRKKFVDFTDPESPKQGVFDISKLPSFLTLLNA